MTKQCKAFNIQKKIIILKDTAVLLLTERQKKKEKGLECSSRTMQKLKSVRRRDINLSNLQTIKLQFFVYISLKIVISQS